MTKLIIKVMTLSLLTLALAVAGNSQFPSQSPYDESYAPKSLRGLKALNVRSQAQIFISMELLRSEIKHSDVKSRVEAMLKKAGISYLSEKDAELTPDAPVLNVQVVATKLEASSYPPMKLEGNKYYSLVIEVALLQKVTVESESKLRITATTWLDSHISISTDEDPRESILESVDYSVFEFIKAYMIGNSKPAPKVSKFFNRGKSNDEPTEAESRPKNLRWGAEQNGLQMAAWPSPVRPVVFCAIRNASERTIHYCDYLLGYHETVNLYARQKGESEWRAISLRPNPYRAYIGVLLCSGNDSLAPGREMAPNWMGDPGLAPKVTRQYTFTESLTAYEFPAHWEGKVECKITQQLFGGRHKDSWNGQVESPIFEINLPLKNKR